jgi:hypothetical protein
MNLQQYRDGLRGESFSRSARLAIRRRRIRRRLRRRLAGFARRQTRVWQRDGEKSSGIIIMNRYIPAWVEVMHCLIANNTVTD